MSLSKKVARNSGALLIGTGIDIIIKLGLTILLARYLGAEGYGEYNIVIAFLSMVSILTDLGLSKIAIREIAKTPEKKEEILGNNLGLKFALSFVSILLSITSARFLGYSEEILNLIQLASVTILFPAIGLVYVVILEIDLKIAYYSLANILSRFIYFVLVLGIVKFTNGGITQIFYAYIIMSVTNLIILLVSTRHMIKTRILMDFNIWKHALKEAMPLGLVTIFVTIYTKLNLLILAKFQGEVAVGLYAAAFALIINLAFIPNSLNVSLFPLMSGFFKNSTKAWEKTFMIGLKFLVIFALPASALISYGSTEIIGILYGSKFLPASADVLRILVWMATFMFINGFLSDSLVTLNRQRTVMKIAGVQAFVGLSASLLLVPKFAEIGLAMAAITTEIVGSVLCLYVIVQISEMSVMRELAKITLANIPIILLLASIGTYTLFLVAPLVGLAYILLLFGFKVISDEEIALFRKIIKRD